MDKHSTYYSVWDELKDAKECLLCTLEVNAMHAYFSVLLNEVINEPQLRAKLVQSNGYCHRHACFLADMRESFKGDIFQEQLKLIVELLLKWIWLDLKKDFERKDIAMACPACQYQMEARQHYLVTLREGLAIKEIKAAYEASPGLCLPHLEILMGTSQEPLFLNYIYETEERNLIRVWDGMQEFLEKHEHHDTHESSGEEPDSWDKAIQKLIGNKSVF